MSLLSSLGQTTEWRTQFQLKGSITWPRMAWPTGLITSSALPSNSRITQPHLCHITLQGPLMVGGVFFPPLLLGTVLWPALAMGMSANVKSAEVWNELAQWGLFSWTFPITERRTWLLKSCSARRRMRATWSREAGPHRALSGSA